ncbi:hypothetical protein F4777DRAFT_591057 [Nemania sp. FL0916]|nr:hypothetical protein F4777DRAFT_591057 [Nemania sp. FL0916]
MAQQSSSVLSRTMQSVSLTKIRELEKQREKYESRKNEVLSSAGEHTNDIRKRITHLLRGVKELCGAKEARDARISNINLWLQQSSYDPSVPPHMLESYETLLRSKLEVQSRKLSIGYLWSRLVLEWMNSSTPMDDIMVLDNEESDADRQETRIKELCEKFEKVVFEQLETSETKIEEYMRELFSGDESEKSLKSLRSTIENHEYRLFLQEKEPFDRDTLRWCVNGLLAEDLLSDEKQDALREFLENPVVLDEIADVLNLRFADFDSWSWEAGEQGIPVLPRPQLNGKVRIWQDEDVLQSIFIHYIGIKNCVELKSALNAFLNNQEGPWNWSGGRTAMRNVDRVRYEYFQNDRLGSTWNLDKTRSTSFREPFFLSLLPTSVTTIGKDRAYVNDGDARGVEDKDEKKQKDEQKFENINIKQMLLRTLATEAIVHRTLYGEVAVIQSDLQWYATGLSHTTIFAVMRFLGFSERLVSFYRKVLQAPLNMTWTPEGSPSGEPRTRKRGVPMAHAPEKLIGEMILFVMDFAVNKTTGMLLYRLHDDLFLCGQPSKCADAWKEMERFADVMGVEFNMDKTGSVYLTNPEKSRDAEVEATLPNGVVRIGHLLLDQDSGEWVLDKDQIDNHVAQLQKQLAACNNILDWVKTWNSCIRRFFSHTLGEPAYCFGLKHVDSVLQTHQRIQEVLFKAASGPTEGEEPSPATQGSIVEYLKTKIKERFVDDEKELYDRYRRQNGKLGSPEARLSRLRILYQDDLWFEFSRLILETELGPAANNDFFSFEEFTRHRESTSFLLNRAYSRLLKVPSQKGAKLEHFATEAIRRAKLGTLNDEKLLQVEWVLQLYQDELQERWDGPKLVDAKYLPLGLLALMRRKAVHLSSIPTTSNGTTATSVISSRRSLDQPPGTSPSTTSNPLKLIPAAYRPVLTTLHVLYPSMLLPALDLLDRRLVTRVALRQHVTKIQTDPVLIAKSYQENQDALGKQGDNQSQILYHLICSAQPQSRRRQQTISSGGQVYVVRLDSWNCSCAAFAFSAFPPLPPLTSSLTSEPAMSRYHIHSTLPFQEDSALSDANEPWDFGGLGADGKDGSGAVPCCKHLLACVLAEKWDAVLGSYVEERLVSREEGAGLVGNL